MDIQSELFLPLQAHIYLLKARLSDSFINNQNRLETCKKASAPRCLSLTTLLCILPVTERDKRKSVMFEECLKFEKHNYLSYWSLSYYL